MSPSSIKDIIHSRMKRGKALIRAKISKKGRKSATFSGHCQWSLGGEVMVIDFFATFERVFGEDWTRSQYAHVLPHESSVPRSHFDYIAKIS